MTSLINKWHLISASKIDLLVIKLTRISQKSNSITKLTPNDPGYSHTFWRPLQSWRGCTLGILTHPGDLYNLGEGVSWVYSHILETCTILERMHPGYTHTSWRPVQSWRGCNLGILTHLGNLYNLGEGVTWVYSHILETCTILERVYPRYTHTSWRPVQSWRGCTLGILTHPGDLCGLGEVVP